MADQMLWACCCFAGEGESAEAGKGGDSSSNSSMIQQWHLVFMFNRDGKAPLTKNICPQRCCWPAVPLAIQRLCSARFASVVGNSFASMRCGTQRGCKLIDTCNGRNVFAA